MVVALIAFGWALSMLGALTVGFHWSKRVSSRTTLRSDLARRLRLAWAYVQATVAVLVPAYGRHLRRKRAQARQTYRDSLVPIENRFTRQG